jgi:hypothetical protein
VWFDHFGASLDEQTMAVPGYQPPPHQRLRGCQGITIAAPAEKIWPWLVQMGQGRGGFYSYTWLENVVGCNIQNVKRIVPELQTLKVGDQVWLHPKAPPLTVRQLIPNRVIAFEGWTLFLFPVNEGRTRLVSRLYDWSDPSQEQSLLQRILNGRLLDFAHWFMERRMFVTIRRLAEGRISNAELATRATAVWFLLLVVAILNGALREFGVAPFVAEPLAQQISVVTAVILFAAVVWGVWRWLRITHMKQAWCIGLFWLAATICAETFVFGRWLSHRSWPEILSAYDIVGGNWWPLVLLWIAVLPSLAVQRAGD